ncbi:MAG: Chitin synthase, class 5 [Claussenomyces sp. TS43310]|nr:MAG: Chitin synthase, class 5 [Claussenomyces sp. TS43310]
MLISLTVGKVDAGVAVLLTQDKRLIEFPSILLPPNISSGSIVDITVSRNLTSETKSQNAFAALQDSIYQSFGASEPAAPILRCRNATQTSVVLEWDPIDLATADVISLSLYRNGQKAGSIPRPTIMQSTKISGLAVDTEYTFHLILRTTAGTYSSEKVSVKTHKMTDLSGITITPGILPAQLKESLMQAIERIGAKMADTVRIDTTHFVTTEGRGIGWEKAVEMNIPVVRPEWVEGCERGGRIVGVRQYYLDADPRQRTLGQGQGQGSMAAASPTAEGRMNAPLPESPAAEQRVTNGTNGRAALPLSPPANAKSSEHESEGQEEETDGEDGKEGEEGSEPLAEQKVRVEDRDRHKVAIRPAEAAAEISESEVTPEEPEGSKTPERASFQDVAL